MKEEMTIVHYKNGFYLLMYEENGEYILTSPYTYETISVPKEEIEVKEEEAEINVEEIIDDDEIEL